MARILVTGSAGFIGFHLSKLLLYNGATVYGYDGLTDYYDVRLKSDRNLILMDHPRYTFRKGMLEDREELNQFFDKVRPTVVIHLAAQAGVRYSMENPAAYIDSNIVGTFNVMEASRKHKVKHLLMASTSSVYGAEKSMPYLEDMKTDKPLTIYAATKKATEVMAHSYAHLYGLPTTMLRFFTVYGPWGRPDMALFKFTKGILEGTPIDIYNYGDMYRDFTYVDDLARSIYLLTHRPPKHKDMAPYRVLNVGNSYKVKLTSMISAVERELGKKALRNNMPMQDGDVPATWADTSALQKIAGYAPSTSLEFGVKKFVNWYTSYYGSQ